MHPQQDSYDRGIWLSQDLYVPKATQNIRWRTSKFQTGYETPIRMCDIFKNLVTFVSDCNVSKTYSFKLCNIYPWRRDKQQIDLYTLSTVVAAAAADSIILLHLSPSGEHRSVITDGKIVELLFVVCLRRIDISADDMLNQSCASSGEILSWVGCPQDTSRTTDYRRTRLDRWIQTELAFTLAKNATRPNPFEIIPLQTTRKENNWKTEEALARAAVTLETERIKGSNPWWLWRWWWWWRYVKPS